MSRGENEYVTPAFQVSFFQVGPRFLVAKLVVYKPLAMRNLRACFNRSCRKRNDKFVFKMAFTAVKYK